jgi:hypothetical protein
MGAKAKSCEGDVVVTTSLRSNIEVAATIALTLELVNFRVID